MAAIEFAMILPVMLILLMGVGELLYQAYAQAILDGAVQKAGRDSGIQGNGDSSAAIDADVLSMVRMVAKRATYKSTRLNYDTFSQVAPEPFVDTNSNGIRDPGECFTDQNGNKMWDADPGIVGQGGANEVVAYTMTITYPRLFPVAAWLGWASTATISASTMLKNQPYATQVLTTPTTVCT